jgi:hypothetical protein
MDAMLECSNRDIAAAGMWQDQIKNILKAHQQGERNNAMLQDIKVLCICIIHTIRDPYCQQKMCEVANHSDELFAIDQRSRRGRSSTQSSSIFRRRLILESLEAFDDRLRALETTRQYHRGPSGTNNEMLRADLVE